MGEAMKAMGRPSVRDQVISGLPGTRSQIERKSGASSSSVGKWLAILRAEGAIHVGGWRRSKMGSKRPVFVLGAGVDKPEPKTLTAKQIGDRYRKRHPERRREIKANSEQRAKIRASGHGWLTTLIITKGL